MDQILFNQYGAAGTVSEVEKILGYVFNDKELLVDALTHSSSIPSPRNYQRLEFVGDAVIQLAVSNYLFLQSPPLDPRNLTLLRAANVSTEKLARVAVRRGFYKFVRRNSAALDDRGLALHTQTTFTVQRDSVVLFYPGLGWCVGGRCLLPVWNRKGFASSVGMEPVVTHCLLGLWAGWLASLALVTQDLAVSGDYAVARNEVLSVASVFHRRGVCVGVSRGFEAVDLACWRGSRLSFKSLQGRAVYDSW